ncbi:MAG: MotA/TolQ/ExbB proton channel family protein [Phycisphaerae bacterium]|jgi:biopolymer transport protein ExbB|nr:MotA/TolQ/ExbB proton channel family protein [Phycisphaerae bacterium]
MSGTKIYGWLISGWILSVVPTVVIAQTPGAGETVSIDYFQRFVRDGGFITWGILIPLSMITLALILDHAWRTRSSRLLNKDLLHDISGAMRRGDVRAAWDFAHQDETFLGEVVSRGLKSLPTSHEAAEYAIIEATEEQATKLLGRIEYLNIIGNVSPMIGLFGTVYGIILAFNTLSEVAQQGGVTRADQLAEGISIALVTTFWGLIIAIPALGMYGLFRNRIDAVSAQAASRVLEMIRNVDAAAVAELRDMTQKNEDAETI